MNFMLFVLIIPRYPRSRQGRISLYTTVIKLLGRKNACVCVRIYIYIYACMYVCVCIHMCISVHEALTSVGP